MYFAPSRSILALFSSTFVRFAVCIVAFSTLFRVANGAPTYDISPAKPTGECELVKSKVLVTGDLLTKSGEEEKKIPFRVQVDLMHQDHTVFVEGDDWKVLHNYLQADGKFDVGGQKMNPKMMANRGLIFSETQGDQVVLYSPLGSISRDYLELIDTPADATVLAQMLPGQAVEVGHEWKPADKHVAMMLRIDLVTKSDLQCKLAAVSNGVATIELQGAVSGAMEGVATEFKVEGRFLFSLTKRKIYRIEAELHENRSIGEAQPGFIADTKIVTDRSPCREPELSMAGVMRLVERTGDALQLIAFQTRDGVFSCDHDRRWRSMTDRSDLTVLRLVDQGEAIAFCRITKLPDLPRGKRMTMESFQSDVRQSLGDSFSELLRANKTESQIGDDVLRVEAAGQASNEPVRWVCYHIANDLGQRVSVVFTMEEKYVERVSTYEGMIPHTFRFSKNVSLQAKRRMLEK